MQPVFASQLSVKLFPYFFTFLCLQKLACNIAAIHCCHACYIYLESGHREQNGRTLKPTVACSRAEPIF